MVYIIFICFVTPLALMLPFLQKQSRWLVGFMLIGAASAVSASEINGILQGMWSLPAIHISLRVAPVTEEVIKAIPILLFALLGSDDRRKVLPLSMSVGIGFAILENTYVLVSNVGSVSLGWALIRGFSTSLMHGMCTFLVGCGIIFVYKQKKLFYTGTFGLLAIAITFHAVFNLLVCSQWNRAGMMLPIVVYLTAQYVLRKKKNSKAVS